MSDKTFLSTLEKLAIIEKDLSSDLTPLVLETPSDELIRQATLTVSEEIELRDFLNAGCPDIQNYDENRMKTLYLAGHDFPELIKIFPYASIGGIAFLKVQGNWKGKREEFLSDLQFKSKLMLANSKMKTIFTISSLLNAFNSQLENSLLKYAASNDINCIPTEFIPKGIRDAKELITLLKMFGDLKLNTDVNPNEQPKTAVQINIDNNQNSNKPVVVDALEYLKQPFDKK